MEAPVLLARWPPCAPSASSCGARLLRRKQSVTSCSAASVAVAWPSGRSGWRLSWRRHGRRRPRWRRCGRSWRGSGENRHWCRPRPRRHQPRRLAISRSSSASMMRSAPSWPQRRRRWHAPGPRRAVKGQPPAPGRCPTFKPRWQPPAPPPMTPPVAALPQTRLCGASVQLRRRRCLLSAPHGWLRRPP